VLNASNNFHPPPAKVFQQTTPPKRPVPHFIPLDTAEIALQQPQALVCDSTATSPRQHRYNTRLNVTKYGVNAVIDEKSGKTMEYRHLLHNPKYKQVWSNSMSNELGSLTQGNSRVQGTNTMYFLPYENIPIDRRKDVTYAKIVVDYRPQKQEKERTRITVGGNLINYPDNVSTKTAEISTAKILINSTISTPNAKFCVLDIHSFYLGTPMQRYEYMFTNIEDIPDDIIKQYNLTEIASNRKVYA